MPADSHVNVNGIEPIQEFIVDITGAPLTGKTDLFVRVFRDSDNQFFDWSDFTFKAVGHTTLDQILTEIDATNAPGLYEVTAGFNILTITNAVAGDTYTFIPIQTPGTDAVLPPPGLLKVSQISLTPTGARQVTIHVNDAGPADLPGVEVSIFNDTNTVFLVRGTTDSNGDVTFALDDASYNARLVKGGFTFTVPEPFTVTADATFIFAGVGVAITPPSAPNLCVIFGSLVNAAGDDLVGACVQAFAVVDPPQVVGGLQLADPVAETVTDQDGFFQIELVRNSLVRFFIEEAGFDQIKTVPDLASQDLTTWP